MPAARATLSMLVPAKPLAANCLRAAATTTALVSSSQRTCGRPRPRCGSAARLSSPALIFVTAMLLHDACHSIDSPKVGAILENVKFPNYLIAGRKEFPLLGNGIDQAGGHHEPSFHVFRSRSRGLCRDRAGVA